MKTPPIPLHVTGPIPALTNRQISELMEEEEIRSRSAGQSRSVWVRIPAVERWIYRPVIRTVSDS